MSEHGNGGELGLVKHEPEPAIKLEFTVNQAGQMPVTWTLSPELVQDIANRSWQEPHLLLVVRNPVTRRAGSAQTGGYEITNMALAPLEKGICTLTFRRAGATEIIPIIIDLGDSDDIRRVNRWLRGNLPEHDDLLHQNGSTHTCSCSYRQCLTALIRLESIPTGVVCEANVPQHLFGKPPPQWQQRLVRKFFETSARDTCQFRRRLWFGVPGLSLAALFVGVVLVPIMCLFRVLAMATYLFVGVQPLNWKFLHPLDFEENILGEYPRRSVWFQKKNGDFRNAFFWIINLPVVTLGPLLLFGIFNLPKHHGHSKRLYPLLDWGWWRTVFVADGVLLVVAVLACIGVVAYGRWSASRSQASADSDSYNCQSTAQREVVDSLQGLTSASSSSTDGRRVQVGFYTRIKGKLCQPYEK